MWSYYADKHRGIAYEFSSTGAFFGGAFAVEYFDTLPRIDPHPITLAMTRLTSEGV